MLHPNQRNAFFFLLLPLASRQAHKGTITAQSAGRNKGATFTLVFPTCEKVEERIAPAALPRLSERQPLRILLVEDHEDTNRSLTNLLRRRGYHVQSALNFQSALNLGTNEEFDVLISDLALPDGTGIDLMQKPTPRSHFWQLLSPVSGWKTMSVKATRQGSSITW